VGIIGFGRIAEVHLRAWRAVDRVRVVAICDHLPEARRRAAMAGSAVYSDLDQLLEQETLDAVSVCTPPVCHLPHALACLDRGIPVLCEKPLAVDADSALSLLDAARSDERRLQMAAKYRHVPAIRAAREHLRQGDIGEILAFRITFSFRVDMAARWESDVAVSGGGVVIDNGSHALDLARFLFGPISRLQAVPGKPAQTLDIEDSALLLVVTDGGLPGQIELSWSNPVPAESYLTVQGTQGRIDVGWRASFLHRPGRPPVQFGGAYDKAAVHRRMENFRGLVGGQREPWITLPECLASVRAVDAAYRSRQSGRWVQVQPTERPALVARAAGR